MADHFTAARIGGVSPDAGSRRFTMPLNTVPRPTTTKHMVIEALGASVLGWSGPTTSGISAATKSTVPYSTHRNTAGALVIGTFGSRGGRCMRSGSGGSSVITTTGKIVTKKLRNSTMSGVIA